MKPSRIVFPKTSYTGWGALEKLPELLDEYQPQNGLIITDPVLIETGIVPEMKQLLKEKGYHFTVCSQVEAEPNLAIAETLVDYTREHEFDVVIGLGGGSALDLAKLAAVLAKNQGEVSAYLNLSGDRKIQNKGLPLILIPTTSGTGSEVTNIAMLSLNDTKDVVTHDYLLADIAIIDPALTKTVPPKVTAATGIDALTHAIEAYLSPEASPPTDALALHAIRLIGGSIVQAVENGEDKQARIDMSYGSNLAGLAFFNAGVGGVHALAYPLGGKFQLSHGEANAVLLPYVMDEVRLSSEERLATVYENLGEEIADLSTKEAALACIKTLEKLVADVGIPKSLQAFQIPEDALDDLTKAAMKQTRLLANSPKPLEKSNIHTIYKQAYQGTLKG